MQRSQLNDTLQQCELFAECAGFVPTEGAPQPRHGAATRTRERRHGEGGVARGCARCDGRGQPLRPEVACQPARKTHGDRCE